MHTLEQIKTIPLLDDRQSLECLLAVEYTERFAHGTDGHSRLVLIAKLVTRILELQDENRMLTHGIVELGGNVI